MGAFESVICVYVDPSYVAAGFIPSVKTTFGTPKFISVNLTLLTPVIVGEPLVDTAVHPTTVGVDVTVVEADELAPVITLFVAKIEVDSAATVTVPKFMVKEADALAITVPVIPVEELSLELVTAETVSPTVKLEPCPDVTATV